MYRVGLRDFRCFSTDAEVEVKPLTFLVGENSAGKTSFLAAFRFLLESFSVGSKNVFNRDPYFLGGYEQIAHYHGGKVGRSKSFSLSISAEAAVRRGKLPKGDWATGHHRFEFGDGVPQPELNLYSFSYGGVTIEIDLKEDFPKVSVSRPGTPIAAIDVKVAHMSTAHVRSNLGYFLFILTDLPFRRATRGALPSQMSGIEVELVKLGLEKEEIEGLFDYIRRSTQTLSQDVFAFAPVRMHPSRTYTPSEIVPSSEGSHVPLELARIKKSSVEEWRSINQSLRMFGAESGLFSDIGVRQLGKSNIDPFQIMIKQGGAAMNLVDVGYGVSQALPIIFQLIHARQRTFLLQQPEVHLHPKAQAALGSLLAQSVGKRPRREARVVIVAETHSDYIIDRTRMEIAEGRLKHDDATIIFFEKGRHSSLAQNIYFNEKGELKDVPENFRAFFLEEHARLLGI